MEFKMFVIGLSLGMLGGGLVVANSQKLKKMIKEGESQLKRKMKNLKECECECDCNCEDSCD